MQKDNTINIQEDYISDEEIKKLFHSVKHNFFEKYLQEYHKQTDRPVDKPFNVTLKQEEKFSVCRKNNCKYSWSKCVSLIGQRAGKNLRINENAIRKMLEKAIGKAVDEGYAMFISGMDSTMELLAAEIVLKYRKSNPNIHLICAIPHHGFEEMMIKREAKLYNRIIKEADYVKYMFDEFNLFDSALRYEWMVNLSDKIIGVFYHTSLEHRDILDYAERRSVEVENCLFSGSGEKHDKSFWI